VSRGIIEIDFRTKAVFLDEVIIMKEIRLKKNGYYQVIENYWIISYPISKEFDNLDDVRNYLRGLIMNSENKG